MAQPSAPAREVVVRPLREPELDAADRVMRLAFGTYFGAPDPIAALGDVECVRPRFAAQPGWAFAAELDGELVGSNLATRWGSFAFFGPLSVRPDLWERGIASALMAPIIDLFERWQVRQAGLFTFSNSAKHAGLYQKFGFWPQYLTAVMGKQLASGPPGDGAGATHSQAPEGEREAIVAACGAITGSIFEGLDVEHEIRATFAQGLGDTVLCYEGSELCGFAVCHCGAGEAGSGTCYVKFGAVSPGTGAADRYERLLDACEALAAASGLERVVAGVNLARHDAYRRLLARGYRTQIQGVIMQRPNQPGYCRPDVYVIDDLR
ncbi:MAG TPA: GNAT family N-acetyltransferase [Solirubrobacteraceae bacterium]|nr:GNAT family N-acetyltransferase [Solirubrobacteraceae bacterium]